MAYIPPAGNAVDMQFSSGYIPPAGNAVDMAFTSGNTFVIAGVSSAAFGAIVDIVIQGVSTTGFVGSVTGYQDASASISSGSSVSCKILAYLDGQLSFSGSATPSFLSKAFAAGTYSLFSVDSSTAAFQSVPISSGQSIISAIGQASFEAIYDLTISASSGSNWRIGGIVTEAFDAGSSSSASMVSQKLQAAFVQASGSTSHVMNAVRVQQFRLDAFGSSSESIGAERLKSGTSIAAGVSSEQIKAGAIDSRNVNIAGFGNLNTVSASFSLSSLIVSGSSAVNGTLGGIRSESFSALGSAFMGGGLQTLNDSIAFIYQPATFTDFTSNYRVQALRYETIYIISQGSSEVFASEDTAESFVLTVQNETSILLVHEDIPISIKEEVVYIFPEHVSAQEIPTN